MILAPLKVWPPIISDADLPRFVVWRDRLLTVAMWLLLAWLCRHMLHWTLDQLLALFGRPRHLPPLDWRDRWARLQPYFIVVGLLAIWLIIWGLASLRRIRRYSRMPQPAALTLEEQARQGGCSAAELSEWRKPRVCTAHLDEHGAICVVPALPHHLSHQAARDFGGLRRSPRRLQPGAT
jgi:poly-beta-1,6-N-acetyl-D-glucosamine biosynthesis protein PgaD